jgi:hypothetical protein
MGEQPVLCPSCGAELDAATAIGELASGRPVDPNLVPKAGDFSLCGYCFVYLVILEGGGHRIMTNAEWIALDIPTRTGMSRLRDRVRAYKEAYGRTTS